VNQARARYPFNWIEIHPDNGTEFINDTLYRYTQEEDIAFSRSRPYKKNDNCLVEQKNSTHVRRHVGYLRHTTQEEQDILNDLYRNEFRLYKNFFQPVMKLISKERVGSKIHRKYDKARTPYQRVLESLDVSHSTKQQLTELYDSLNPAELKREIDRKLKLLWKTYEKKKKVQEEHHIKPYKKTKPRLVTKYTAQRKLVRLPTYTA
jgi:Ni,Fe-hydrogenase I large subunit